MPATMLWDPDPLAGGRFSMALGEGVEVVALETHIGRALEANPQLRLLVVGPDVPLEQVGPYAEQARAERPEVGVILLRHRLDVHSLSAALRWGIREVVPADDQAHLVDAVTRSRELSARTPGGFTQAETRRGAVVTVFSAKGGVGKTTVATNLAAYLAHSGLRVLLVDLDVTFGDVAISLHVEAERSLADLVGMQGHVDEQGVRSLVHRHEPSGLDVMAAPLDPADAERLPAAAVAEMIRVARGLYDVVVLDTPPAFTDHVLTAFDQSDLLVMVGTLDIPAIKNVRIAVATLDELGMAQESRVLVLNRADLATGLRPEDVETALKHRIDVRVPSDLAVATAVNNGVAIVLDNPKNAAGAALRELADQHVRPRLGLPVPTTGESSGRRWLRGRR